MSLVSSHVPSRVVYRMNSREVVAGDAYKVDVFIVAKWLEGGVLGLLSWRWHYWDKILQPGNKSVQLFILTRMGSDACDPLNPDKEQDEGDCAGGVPAKILAFLFFTFFIHLLNKVDARPPLTQQLLEPKHAFCT